MGATIGEIDPENRRKRLDPMGQKMRTKSRKNCTQI